MALKKKNKNKKQTYNYCFQFLYNFIEALKDVHLHYMFHN